jgi:uncharacterized protein
MELIEATFVALLLAALLAGMVDAVVGGGGLIQIPALFTLHPGESPASLFGTNKLASVFGTANAAWRYARRIQLPWRTLLPAALAAFALSYLGAMAVAWLPRETIRPVLLVLLVVAAVYTLKRKDFGRHHQPLHSGRREFVFALLLGGLIGFYDGFFGPGTGSFLIFLFIRFFGFDFLHASASAKLVNVATNLAAIAFFLPNGYWLPVLAAGMAVANVCGSIVGTQLALRFGNGFIRYFFLIMLVILIGRFGWDTFLLYR